jgi:hypothetical protein
MRLIRWISFSEAISQSDHWLEFVVQATANMRNRAAVAE